MMLAEKAWEVDDDFLQTLAIIAKKLYIITVTGYFLKVK